MKKIFNFMAIVMLNIVIFVLRFVRTATVAACTLFGVYELLSKETVIALVLLVVAAFVWTFGDVWRCELMMRRDMLR